MDAQVPHGYVGVRLLTSLATGLQSLELALTRLLGVKHEQATVVWLQGDAAAKAARPSQGRGFQNPS